MINNVSISQEALLFKVIGSDTAPFTRQRDIPEGAWESFVVRIENWSNGYGTDQKTYGEMMCRGALILSEGFGVKPFADLLDMAAFLRFEIAETQRSVDWKKFGQRLLPEDCIETDCSCERYAPLGEYLRQNPFCEPLHCVPSEIKPGITQLLERMNVEWKVIPMRTEESYQEFIFAEGVPPENRAILSCETSLFAKLLHSTPQNISGLLMRAEQCYNEALNELRKDRVITLLGECFWYICTAKPWYRGEPSIAEMFVKGVFYFKGYGFLPWKPDIIPWEEVVKARTAHEFGAKFHTLIEGL